MHVCVLCGLCLCTFPTHLWMQVVTSSEPCYFYYCLLGNDITTEPFSPPTLLPERASVRVRGGEHQLQLFLSAQGDLKIHLSQGRVSLCHGLVPLKGVFTDSPLHTTLQLTQGTSSAHCKLYAKVVCLPLVTIL